MSALGTSYDRVAGHYDRRWSRYLDQTLSPAVEILRASRPRRILDVACGSGELARRVVSEIPGTEVMGIDASLPMIEVARNKLAWEPRASFHQAEAHALPFKDAFFDWAVCCSALHHFQDARRVILEMARALKPGGRLLVVDWCRDPWYCRLIDRWLSVFDPAHVRMYTSEELQDLLQEGKFAVERLERFRVTWFGNLKVWDMMLCVAQRIR